MRQTRILLPLLFLLLAAFAASPALAGDDCVVLRSSFDTKLQSPGSFVGNTFGEPEGAVTFEAVSVGPLGSDSSSVIRVTFVGRDGTDGFEAFVRAKDRPSPTRDGKLRIATGELNQGTGRFDPTGWQIDLSGFFDRLTFVGEMQLTTCK